jgi:hypothetical protein
MRRDSVGMLRGSYFPRLRPGRKRFRCNKRAPSLTPCCPHQSPLRRTRIRPNIKLCADTAHLPDADYRSEASALQGNIAIRADRCALPAASDRRCHDSRLLQHS